MSTEGNKAIVRRLGEVLNLAHFSFPWPMATVNTGNW